jgi:cytoskeletal protein RodZ
MSTTSEDTPEVVLIQPGAADLAAERAASAAEAASQAAQSAAGAVERLGTWMALLMKRASQTSPVQVSLEDVPLDALPQENGKQRKGVTVNLKRAAATMGQRLSDLSEGRYGMTAPTPKMETKQAKKAAKRLGRQAWKEAKAEQPGAGVHWFPWVVGMSLGLVIGLIGVSYWQRRRLQDLWEEASHRMQQAKTEARQRLEASRHQSPIMQSGISTGAPGYRSPGTPASMSDVSQQTNGRLESTLQQ